MNLTLGQIQMQMSSQIKEYHRMKEEGREFRSFPQEAAPQRSYYAPKSPQDATLVFESRFECGNLQLVHKQSDKEYNLILQNDINSKGHTQWFYFRIQNTRKNSRIKFNMLNFLKSKSLFNEGMKVLVFSEKKLENEQIGWHRSGEEIAYYQNNYRRESMTNYQRCFYTFTFTYKFEYDYDSVYFAYSQPYSYSDLVDELSEIEKMKLDYVSRNTLCRTLAGNKCEYLTITTRSNHHQAPNQKRGVVISARVHPGESNSSWMMKGVIDFLISDCKEAQALRDNYVFKIIPMLNPDGVINGNYRCSLAGCDLNRRWKYPSPILHPTIYNTKQLIKQFASERPLLLFCDLHGHSRRKNVFMYGNTDAKAPEATRIFPYLMSQIAGPLFSYDYSRFKVQRNKEQTARIALWRELKNPNIFTMEASFCGPKQTSTCIQNRPLITNVLEFQNESNSQKTEAVQSNQPLQQGDLNYHFTTEDLMEVGKKLCQTLLLYIATSLDVNSQIEEIKQYHQKKTSVAGPQGQDLQLTSGKERNIIQYLQHSSKSETRRLTATSLTHKKFHKEPSHHENSSLTVDCISRDTSDSEYSNSSTLMNLNFGSLSIKELVSELKQKIQQEKERKQEKSGISIQEADDESNSDEDSDSGESEDNLDPDQLLQIMPKRIIKKGSAGNPSKRKKPKVFNQINPKKIMKEDETKKEQPLSDTKNQPQRRQSIRSLRDFKKPTQSFLQKFGLVGPTNKVKYGVPIQKKDFQGQTIDSDEEDIPISIELSAMERDIMLCTGYIPDKIKKLLGGIQSLEGRDLGALLQLVKAEGNRIQGVNQPLQFRRQSGSIMVGRSSFYSLKGLETPKGLMTQMLSSNRFGVLEEKTNISDSQNKNIRIDLSRINDKMGGEKNSTQILFSKQASSNQNTSAERFPSSSMMKGGKVQDISSKENYSSISPLLNPQSITPSILNIVQHHSSHYPGRQDQQLEQTEYNGSSVKKGFRVMDLSNFRQDSSHSLKGIAGGRVTTNQLIDENSKQDSRFVENFGRFQKGVKQESAEVFPVNYLANKCQSRESSQSKHPINSLKQGNIIDFQNAADINNNKVQSNQMATSEQSIPPSLMPLHRNSAINRKIQKARQNHTFFGKRPNQTNNFNSKQNLSQIQGQALYSPKVQVPLNQAIQQKVCTDNSFNGKLESSGKVEPPKIIQQNQQFSPNVQFIRNPRPFENTAGLLEKIEEKGSIQNRSSSQGNYPTGSGKYQTLKTKQGQAMNKENGKTSEQPKAQGRLKISQGGFSSTREEAILSSTTNRNGVVHYSQSQIQLNSTFNGHNSNHSGFAFAVPQSAGTQN